MWLHIKNGQEDLSGGVRCSAPNQLNPGAAAWQLVLCVGRFRIGLFFIYLAVSKDPMVLNRASACVCESVFTFWDR